MRGSRRFVTAASRIGDADVDAAAVLVAHPALHQAVLLEPADDARERALAEVNRLAERLHPALLVLALAREPLEHLVLADAQAMRLQRTLERAVCSRMTGQQTAPGVHERLVGESSRTAHRLRHYTAPVQILHTLTLCLQNMLLHVTLRA